MRESVVSLVKSCLRPRVSVIVIVYDMQAQAMNTLHSLTTAYQVGVTASDYEVIVVENESPNMLDAGLLRQLPCRLRYFRRRETEATPVHAIQFGASQARGQNICVMVDGARMVTPGVIRHLIAGHRVSPSAVVTVPGYHLGYETQQEAVGSGYGVETERELLRSIDWPQQGYRLFDIACFSASCRVGFFQPNGESNCISIPRRVWQQLSGVDVRFNFGGGGFVNLDLYKRACEHPGVQHILLPGEGTFHQFHGGVTTGGIEKDRRAALIDAFAAQYREMRGQDFVSPQSSPMVLGQVPQQVQRFVHYSSARLLPQCETLSETLAVPVAAERCDGELEYQEITAK